MVAAVGCSVEKNYALLSFFFDGVPDPRLEQGAAGAGGLAGAGGAPIVSAHTAYAQRRCGECHGEQSRFGFFATGFSGLDELVCLRCHADVPGEYAVMHGPVAAGACLWCHRPHESPHRALLDTASPRLCLQCHGFELGETPRSVYHEDLSRDCLECHHGHGGPDRSLLRPGPPPVTPAPAGEKAEHAS